MFNLIKPTPKQIKKYSINNSNSLLPIPKDWNDFVKLCVIRSGGNMKQFNPYAYQKKLIKLRSQFKNIVIIKSRQLGCTQALSSDDLHKSTLNAASSSCFFMRNQDDVGALSRRIKTMIEGLGEYIKLENDSVSYIKIKNGGDIYLKNSSREGTRSLDSITSQTYDESAFIENIEAIYGASNASSALVENCSKILLSTPSLKSGFYWQRLSENNSEDIEKLCELVASGELFTDFPGFYYFQDNKGVLKVIIHWLCHPVFSEIDKTYQGGYLQYRIDNDNISEEIAQREYNLKFIDSSMSYFSSDLVRSNIESVNNEIDNDSFIFMGIDAAGSGDDYAVCTVLKYQNDGSFYLIDLYRKRHQSSEYHLYHIGELINKYNPVMVGVETTGGTGQVWLEELSKNHYDIKFRKIVTSQETKIAMLDRFKLILESQKFKFSGNSPLVDELLNFRRVGKHLEASSGHHDDIIMSVSFALTVAQIWEYN
jgi:phage terminase large subunit-like protein